MIKADREEENLLDLVTEWMEYVGRNMLEKATVDIAITGVQGAGKSSLINALRGLSDFDKGTVETDMMQVTEDPQGYPYPEFLDVTLWELPGIETPEFSVEKYLERVNYSRYDFFIHVSSECFTMQDFQLSHAIQKTGKRFYYVRSKMDASIDSEKIKPDFNEKETIQRIRKYCLSNLMGAGIFSPKFFLISSWYWEKYDFPLLQKILEKEIVDFKRCALLAGNEGNESSMATTGMTGIGAFFSVFDFAKLRDATAERSLEEVVDKTRQELNALENAKVDIAITGVKGVGKSSLVNGMRGMTDYEEGAAQIGVMETTREIHGYPYPSFPNVILWDLPGIGNPGFTSNNYLKKFNFSRYDFIIIVDAEQFTEIDVLLAREIRKMQKKYYFVRSKIDQYMHLESKIRPNFSESKTLERIKNYCCENLRRAGEPSPKVFLISRRHLNMYDFPLLHETLEKELDGPKRHAFILALPVFSREILEKKKEAMEAHIWKIALVSCAIGAVPIPGLSLACDLSILVGALRSFYKVFGLDEVSLRRAAKQVGKDYQELKSTIKTSLMSSEITPEFVVSLLTKSLLCGTRMALGEAFDFVPALDSLVGGVSSFLTTSYMLRGFLKDIVEDADYILAKATKP